LDRIRAEIAPAKLTLSLYVGAKRLDGYHEIDAEFVSLSFGDLVYFEPGPGLEVEVERDFDSLPLDLSKVPTDTSNLVLKALSIANRSGRVRLVKRIPAGAGLGGGSSDAAAVLRLTNVTQMEGLAHRIGADVPFCVRGGRARVGGIGDRIDWLPFEPRTVVLVLSQLSINTGSVYQAFDEVGPASGKNSLLTAAKKVEPQLEKLIDSLAEKFGEVPLLAGSGSTVFYDRTNLCDLGVEKTFKGDGFIVATMELAGLRLALVECQATEPSGQNHLATELSSY
jgi:4-diphosphocytidyl-2-C-methyl-D-erythritol kinase